LKIADFGTSEVFRVPWASDRRRVKGICGSDPYIAPEEWGGKSYEPDKVDIWAMGVIYFVMKHKTIPWKAAQKTDPHYQNYLVNKDAGHFEYIEELPAGIKNLLYRMLEPDPLVSTFFRLPMFFLSFMCNVTRAILTNSIYSSSKTSVSAVNRGGFLRNKFWRIHGINPLKYVNTIIHHQQPILTLHVQQFISTEN
jgi:serine/threonine protein kinase